jgi:hypothetical protein
LKKLQKRNKKHEQVAVFLIWPETFYEHLHYLFLLIHSKDVNILSFFENAFGLSNIDFAKMTSRTKSRSVSHH